MNILVLCTGNSARSILAEALLNHLGRGRVRAFSAGSHPVGAVNLYALALLDGKGIPAGAARSKSWLEFAGPAAPHLDAVITVCDNAAGEVCPVWPGHPVTVHWGVADPAAVTGAPERIKVAFEQAFAILEYRVRLLLAVLRDGMSHDGLEKELGRIGQISPDQGATA